MNPSTAVGGGVPPSSSSRGVIAKTHRSTSRTMFAYGSP